MSNTVSAQVVRLLDSNKAIAAFFAPFVLSVLGIVANWIESGVFDATELRLAASALVVSAGAALATYLAKVGEAQVVNPVIGGGEVNDPPLHPH
jgi:hypothetical protein